MRMFLKLPRSSESRKTFVLYRDGKKTNDPRIASISTSFLKGDLDYQSAKEECYKVVKQLRQASKSDHYPDKNLDLYNKIKTDYSRRDRTSERSKEMALAGVRRCFNLLGSEIVHSVSIDKIKEIVRTQKLRSRSKLQVYFNIILKSAGRDERLPVNSSNKNLVTHLTVQELTKLINHLPVEYRTPVIVAFVTGCRLGEVFGLNKFGRTRSVYVNRQMYEKPQNGEWYGSPKWVREGEPLRWSPVIEFGWQAVKEWISYLGELDEAEKIRLRKLNWATIVKQACEKAFPGKPHKILSYRDLRHCYAVYWLEKGVTPKTVADAMGNSETVVNKHYHGFIMTDETERLMLGLEK